MARYCRNCGSPLKEDGLCPNCSDVKTAERITEDLPIFVSVDQPAPQPVFADVPRAEENICPKCGNPLRPGVRFCGRCGFALQGERSAAPAAPELPAFDTPAPQEPPRGSVFADRAPARPRERFDTAFAAPAQPMPGGPFETRTPAQREKAFDAAPIAPKPAENAFGDLIETREPAVFEPAFVRPEKPIAPEPAENAFGDLIETREPAVFEPAFVRPEKPIVPEPAENAFGDLIETTEPAVFEPAFIRPEKPIAPEPPAAQNAAGFCMKCGAPLDGVSRFCMKCGAPLAQTAPVAPEAAGVPEQPAPEPEAAEEAAFCRKCGAPLDGISKFCMRCGEPTGGSGTAAAFCEKCGAPVKAGFRFCTKCGKTIKP